MTHVQNSLVPQNANLAKVQEGKESKIFIPTTVKTILATAGFFALAAFVAPSIASTLLMLPIHVGLAALTAAQIALLSHLLFLLPYAIVLGLGYHFLVSKVNVQEKSLEPMRQEIEAVEVPVVKPPVSPLSREEQMYAFLFRNRR